LQTKKVERSITVETIALAVVGALIALTFVVVTGQALARQTFAEANEYATLRALGMSPRQLIAVTLLRCWSIGVVGAIVGCVLAVALSDVPLLGLARKAQEHGGDYADMLVLSVGVLVILVVGAITAFVSAMIVLHTAVRRLIERRARTAGTGLANAASRVALPPAAAVGVRFALRREGGGNGVPIWTTVIGATVTAALLVATWVFTSSLVRVTDTPRLYGWNWDLRVGAPALPDLGGTIVPALQADGAVDGLAAGTVTQARVNDHSVDLLGMQKIEGTVAPTIVEGRAPAARSEVALGSRTMRDLGVDMGDEVNARVGDASTRLTVVGRAVFPEFGDAGQLGTGGFVTLGALDRLLPGAPRNIFFIKFRAGSNLDGERARVSAATEPLPHRVEGWPTDLASIERVSVLPELFSGILTGLAIVLLLHTLVTSIRRRRREIAVLEAIGFVRSQVRASVIMHAVSLVCVALLIGVPVGVIAGRFIWKQFATELGIASNPVIPWGLWPRSSRWRRRSGRPGAGRRRRCAPPSNPGEGGTSVAVALEGAFGFAFRVALGERVAFVVRAFAARYGDLDLGPPVLEVDAGRHERDALLGRRAGERLELAPVQQQLADAYGVEVSARELVRRDVHPVQPCLAVLVDRGVRVLQVAAAVAQRLDLCAFEDDPGLVGVGQDVVVARATVPDHLLVAAARHPIDGSGARLRTGELAGYLDLGPKRGTWPIHDEYPTASLAMYVRK
jgi:ABC-type lipoprotein release transport system permease subunit